MKSEYAQWRDEIEKPRRTIAERVARWFDRPAEQAPEADHFAWVSLADVIPVEGEGA